MESWSWASGCTPTSSASSRKWPRQAGSLLLSRFEHKYKQFEILYQLHSEGSINGKLLQELTDNIEEISNEKKSQNFNKGLKIVGEFVWKDQDYVHCAHSGHQEDIRKGHQVQCPHEESRDVSSSPLAQKRRDHSHPRRRVRLQRRSAIEFRYLLLSSVHGARREAELRFV